MNDRGLSTLPFRVPPITCLGLGVIYLSPSFIFLFPLIIKQQCTQIFRKEAAARKWLPSGEVERLWEDSNPRPSCSNVRTISVRPPLTTVTLKNTTMGSPGCILPLESKGFQNFPLAVRLSGCPFVLPLFLINLLCHPAETVSQFLWIIVKRAVVVQIHLCDMLCQGLSQNCINGVLALKNDTSNPRHAIRFLPNTFMVPISSCVHQPPHRNQQTGIESAAATLRMLHLTLIFVSVTFGGSGA